MNLEQVDAYYMKANVEYALSHKELSPEYKAYLKSLNL